MGSCAPASCIRTGSRSFRPIVQALVKLVHLGDHVVPQVRLGVDSGQSLSHCGGGYRCYRRRAYSSLEVAYWAVQFYLQGMDTVKATSTKA